MNKAQRKKGEHKIPNLSHLDYFKDANTGKLWVYHDKKALVDNPDLYIPREIPPVAFLKEINFYESPLFKVNALEDMLADIEGKYNNILQNKILKKEQITKDEKIIISYFISSLENRTTASKKNIEGFLDRVSKHFSSLEQQYNKGNITENHKQLLKLKEQNIAYSQSLAISVEVNRWQLSDFVFLHNKFKDDNIYFLTSDHPVSIYDFTSMNSFYGIAPLSVTAEIIVPLTPDVALLINNIGVSGHRDISPNFVYETNNRIFNTAYEYIVSSRKITKQFLDRAIDRYRQSFLLEMLSENLSENFLKRHSLPKKQDQK